MKAINPTLLILFVFISANLLSQNTKNLNLSYDKSGHLIERNAPAISIDNLNRPSLPSTTSVTPEFKISPVPTNNFLRLEKENINGTVVIKSALYALTGQLVKTFNDQETNQHTLDVSDVTTGLYLLVLTRNDHSQEIHKVIIND